MLSFGVAFLALLVSFWAAWISRKNFMEMKSQTVEVKRQVEESERANFIAQDALKNTGLALVKDMEDRIYSSSPEVVVAVSTPPASPVAVKYGNKYGYPHPAHDFESQPKELSPVRDWEYDIYYVIRGSLFNSGDNAVLVSLWVARFIEGTSLFSEGLVEVPSLVDPAYGKYFLGPGEEAAFEWRPGGCIDDWLDLDRGEPRGRFLKETLAIFPIRAGSDVFAVELELDAMPLIQKGQRVDPWKVVNDRAPIVDIREMKTAEPRELENLREIYIRE